MRQNSSREHHRNVPRILVARSFRTASSASLRPEVSVDACVGIGSVTVRIVDETRVLVEASEVVVLVIVVKTIVMQPEG